MRSGRLLAALLVAALPLASAGAKDALGVFSEWGAFRDPEVPRCYAISTAQFSRASRDYEAYASVGTWPRRQVRGQVHFRLSREVRSSAPVALRVGDRSFQLTGAGADAWAEGPAMDSAIVAAMRSTSQMRLTARDLQGRRFTDRYSLAGAATAMDAATVGCARLD